jgi:hypothetical protein
MEIAIGIILCLAATLYVVVSCRRKWLQYSALCLNVLLNILLVNLSIAYGGLDANIMQGGPAYLVLSVLKDKLEAGHESVELEIGLLLEEMDPKNAGGTNGPAMIEYYKNHKASRHQAEAQPTTASNPSGPVR